MEAMFVAIAAVEMTALLGWAAWVSNKLNSIERQDAETHGRIEHILEDHERRLTDLEGMFPRTIIYTHPYPEGPA